MDDVVLRVRLTPRGGRDALIKREDCLLHARVAAPPLDGAANRALIALLARTLNIAKSRIAIQSGETGREKALRIEGLSSSDLAKKLALLLPDQGSVLCLPPSIPG